MYTTKAERTLQSCVVLSAETQHIQALDINSATLSLVSGRRCYQMSSQGVNGVPRQEWRSKKLLQQWRSGVWICLHASLSVTRRRAPHLILTDTSLNLPECTFLQAKTWELAWVTLFYIIVASPSTNGPPRIKLFLRGPELISMCSGSCCMSNTH